MWHPLKHIKRESKSESGTTQSHTLGGVAVTTLPFSNHPTLSTTNELSTTTKIPVKKLGKEDMLAELAETTKADQ